MKTVVEKYKEKIEKNPENTEIFLKQFQSELLLTWKQDMIKSYQEGFNGACDVLIKANASVQNEYFKEEV